MKVKKRQRLKHLSLVVSSVVTLSAPGGVSKLYKACKAGKSGKKSRADHLSTAPTGLALAQSPPPPDPPVTPLAGLRLLDFDDEPAAWRMPGAASAQILSPNFSDPIERHPWHCQIATTVFWIGEKPTTNNPTPNQQSCWDEQWADNYGGFDDPAPVSRRGFLPASFVPKQNPFYVALPYNDLCSQGHKGEARKLIPWFKDAHEQRNKSVCKGRWIAIRRDNKICYAQWEDAGPSCTDDAEYVFGKARPKSSFNNSAGLDVSPAVRDFLNLTGEEATDWRFVDFEEVPYGPWSEYGSNNTFVQNRGKLPGTIVAMAGARKSELDE